MARLVLVLLVCVFASFCASKSYYFHGFRPRHFYKRTELHMKPCLKYINELRAKHNAKALEWGKYEARDATTYAKMLAASRSKVLRKDPQTQHSDKAGELLYRVPGGGSPAEKCIKAVKHWYSEYQAYVRGGGCKTDNGVEGTENFSQLVWKSSDLVGLAVEGDIVDARFFPHGNFEHEFNFDVECLRE